MKTGIPKEIEIKESRVICTPGGARMFVPQGHEVFVGIAIDQGGCAEAARHTTHDDRILLKQEVIHYCGAIVPGAYAFTATQALTNATVPYAMKLAKVGAERSGIYARPAHGLEHLPGQGGSSRRRRGSRSAFVAESISA